VRLDLRLKQLKPRFDDLPLEGDGLQPFLVHGTARGLTLTLEHAQRGDECRQGELGVNLVCRGA